MKRALPLVLLGAAALLVCLGLAALGANVLSGRSDSVDLSLWKTPVDQVDYKKINPALALETLAGTANQPAIDDALQQGSWETAFAALAFTPDLNDAGRAGTLLTLGSRYAAAKETAKAAWCYQYVVTLSIISPLPSDLVRAQTLLAAAQGLAEVQQPVAARLGLDQAYLISQYSPALPRESRTRLYEQISEQYGKMGVNALAAQARQKGIETAGDTGEDSNVSARRPYALPSTQWTPGADVQAATQARIQAAKELMDQLSLRPPKSEKDLPTDLIQALGDKLVEEDGALKDYYAAQDKAATETPAQAAVLLDKIRWLALKQRVARKGFGLALVPEWQDGAKDITQELYDAQDQFFKLAEEDAGSSDTPTQSDRNTEDVLRSELVAGRLGLAPYDENDLVSRLNEIASKLKDDQVEALRLDAFQRNKVTQYLLVPDDLYGQGEKALPK